MRDRPAVAVGARARWRGLSPLGPRSPRPDADAASRGAGRVRFACGPKRSGCGPRGTSGRHRPLSRPGRPGQRGAWVLDHAEHLRGHRPVDQRDRPGRAGSVAVATGVLPGLALGDLLANEPGGLGGWLGRPPGSAVACDLRGALGSGLCRGRLAAACRRSSSRLDPTPTLVGATDGAGQPGVPGTDSVGIDPPLDLAMSLAPAATEQPRRASHWRGPSLSESGRAPPAAWLLLATSERLASTGRAELGRGALAGVAHASAHSECTLIHLWAPLRS